MDKGTTVVRAYDVWRCTLVIEMSVLDECLLSVGQSGGGQFLFSLIKKSHGLEEWSKLYVMNLIS